MTSKPRNATLSVGMLAAVLLAAGCQSHVGTAANIGDQRISTKSLNSAWLEAQQSPTEKAQGASLERQVLTQLVDDKLVSALAANLHVVVQQSDIDQSYAALVATAVASKTGQSDAELRREAVDEVTAEAIARAYSVQTKKVDAIRLFAIPVKDQATGVTVLGLIQKSPGDAATIAEKYSSNQSLAQRGGDAGIQGLDSLQTPSLGTDPIGQYKVTSIQGEIVVTRVDAHLDEADFEAGLATAAKVSVNPRFGTWKLDPSTSQFGVTDAISDIVAPATDAAEGSPAPVASAAPGASAAPSAESASEAPGAASAVPPAAASAASSSVPSLAPSAGATSTVIEPSATAAASAAASS